jgi:hypothetical protein
MKKGAEKTRRVNDLEILFCAPRKPKKREENLFYVRIDHEVFSLTHKGKTTVEKMETAMRQQGEKEIDAWWIDMGSRHQTVEVADIVCFVWAMREGGKSFGGWRGESGDRDR